MSSLDPSPLTRGPGNHRLHVGGFNSKFVSKTLCNLSIKVMGNNVYEYLIRYMFIIMSMQRMKIVLLYQTLYTYLNSTT